MPSLPAPCTILAPLHLLAYSTLLGTQLYQSFIIVKLAHRALPSPAFTSLQKRVFPVYFRAQSALIVLAALTYPPRGLAALIQNSGDWIPLVVAGVTAVANMMVFGPRTSGLMMVRRLKAEAISKRDGEVGAVGEEMKSVDRAFKWNHAMSIHLNLVTIGATLWYGWGLASKFEG